MASQARYYARPSEAQDFAAQLLLKAGLPQEHADLMAKCLVQADVRGVVRTLSHPPKPQIPIIDNASRMRRHVAFTRLTSILLANPGALTKRTHTVSLVSSSTWAV